MIVVIHDRSDDTDHDKGCDNNSVDNDDGRDDDDSDDCAFDENA